MAHPVCLFVLFVLLVAATKMPWEETALLAGTLQKLSNQYFIDIYVFNPI
jgi:hypothetical protein